MTTTGIGNIRPINIEEEMRNSYLDYAMSVIVARALPDVRDGLKPVQRRILYAMNELSLSHNSPYKKSARIVGEVMGKYHPHGDAPIYEAMVRLAQTFSMRYLLVDGQGNFGSIDDDPPAAMRYTEARLAAIAAEMLMDIDKNTVNFAPNFDDSLKEPTVLSSRLPNLLVNGSSGIAVGMATNIPPHNLGEVCDAITYLIDSPDATVDDLISLIPGPDFPTAGIILGREGIKNAYATGRGRIVIHAKTQIEEAARGERARIIVTELPYQTNKAALVERIADLVKDKRLEGIAELRDESDREGIRMVIELKREARPPQVLNNLYKHTALQSVFFINMLALVEGQPKPLTLKETLQHFIDFRHLVITRRSRFDLDKAKERAHILEGFRVALDNIEEVIATIRKAENTDSARLALMKKFSLSQIQAQAILDMQLRRLAALERQKILDEYAEVVRNIAYLEDLLANPRKILFLIKEEAKELKTKYADPRRTRLAEEEATEFNEEDLIPHQQVVVTMSHRSYVKRVPVTTFRLQHRPGRGVTGVTMPETDGVRLLCTADTHDNLLFFTNRGRVYHLKCYELPAESSRTAKGMPLVNLLLALDPKEEITAMLAVTDFTSESFMLFATSRGEVKKTPLENFASVRSSGLIAIDLEPKDELVTVRLAKDSDETILVTKKGQFIRFSVGILRSASRTSGGVRGIKLEGDDRVIAMDIVSPDDYFLVVTNQGFGKVSPMTNYPPHGRGGKGFRAIKLTSKTGEVAAAQVVGLVDELIILSAKGIVLRTSVEEIRVISRYTQGVSLMKLDSGDKVVSIAAFGEPDKEEANTKNKDS